MPHHPGVMRQRGRADNTCGVSLPERTDVPQKLKEGQIPIAERFLDSVWLRVLFSLGNCHELSQGTNPKPSDCSAPSDSSTPRAIAAHWGHAGAA